MYFRTASLIARMVVGKKGQEYKVMDEYDFLWTDEERTEARIQKILKSFHIKETTNGRV